VILVIPLGFFLLFLQFLRRFVNVLKDKGNQAAPPLRSAVSEDLPDQETKTGMAAERSN
jgi:hypothetical protein